MVVYVWDFRPGFHEMDLSSAGYYALLHAVCFLAYVTIASFSFAQSDAARTQTITQQLSVSSHGLPEYRSWDHFMRITAHFKSTTKMKLFLEQSHPESRGLLKK